MRLVQIEDDGSFSLVTREGKDIPPYTILSHTWGSPEDEVTYQDMFNESAPKRPGYKKMTFCVEQTIKDGVRHFWNDTCCIDKSSSAELSEAITSMFRYYKNSVQCYVYLADVSFTGRTLTYNGSHPTWMGPFRNSKWFRRGWTLQELLAPRVVRFFSQEGIELGDKMTLEQHISEVTKVPLAALRGSSLNGFTVEERMSWTRNRQTTKEEDGAYCLLGIFGVTMLPNYGESQERAFKRLRKEIEDNIDDEDAKEAREEQKRRQILMDSLQFAQMNTRFRTIKDAHNATCKWLLHNPQYLQWIETSELHNHHGVLWIKGKPGAGKSTLMKYAVKSTQTTMRDHTIISHFFNARGEEMEKSVVGTYMSLLWQLLARIPSLPCPHESLLPSVSYLNRTHRWSVNELEALLQAAVLSLEQVPVVCFIDALDECGQEQIRDMLRLFERISELAIDTNIQFRVCLASRYYPHVTIKKGLSLELGGQVGHTQDIANYIAGELRIPENKQSERLRGLIEKKACGIFMWVVLVVNILNQEYDRGRVHSLEQRLEQIPADLYDLFQDILTRDARNEDELVLCIQWVLFATQPLRPEQLYFAIIVGTTPLEDTTLVWDTEALSKHDIRRFILDASKGLTEITRSDRVGTVQFIHESVREFLLKGDSLGRIWPHLREKFHAKSHERLKQCCLRYMSVCAIRSPRFLMDLCCPQSQAQEDETLREINLRHPLLIHAVASILRYADRAEELGISQAQFLRTFPRQAWIKWMRLFFKINWAHLSTDSASLLYACAVLNAPHLLQISPTIHTCMEVGSEKYGPPLLAAVAARSKRAFAVFLDALGLNEQDKSRAIHLYDVNHRSKQPLFHQNFEFSYETKDIFWYLTDFGSDALLAHALETISIRDYSRDPSLQSLVFRAVQRGHTDIVRLLITKYNVGVNRRNLSRGLTPLMQAVIQRHTNIVKLLLGTRIINLDATDRAGFTVLMWAAERNYDQMIRMLLNTGKANINARTNTGVTVLMLAMPKASQENIALLLNTDGIDVNAKDNSGVSALLIAVDYERTDVVGMLLRIPGIDVNAESQVGSTPLMLAALHGHKKIVDLLLGTGAVKIDAEDRSGFTAKGGAVMRGHHDVVEMLEAARQIQTSATCDDKCDIGTITKEERQVNRKRKKDEDKEEQNQGRCRKRARKELYQSV